MFQEKVVNGSKVAIIHANEPEGPFTINLYVNYGETITLQARKAKTINGARKAAQKLVTQW